MKLKMILMLLLVLALGLAACGGGSDPTNTPPPAADNNGDAEADEPDEEAAPAAATGSRNYSASLLDIDSMIKRALAPRGVDPLYNRVVEIVFEDDTVRIEGVRRIGGEDLSMVLVQTLTVEDGALVSALEPGGTADVEPDDPRLETLNDILVRSYIRLLPEIDREFIFASVTIGDDAIVFSYDLE
jgi:hypothetical protein